MVRYYPLNIEFFEMYLDERIIEMLVCSYMISRKDYCNVLYSIVPCQTVLWKSKKTSLIGHPE